MNFFGIVGTTRNAADQHISVPSYATLISECGVVSRAEIAQSKERTMERKGESAGQGGNSNQVDKFRDLARELECDDDEAAFDERLKRIATVPKSGKPSDKPT
jgi:hypothetical protein